MGLFKDEIVELFKFFNRNGTVGKSLVMIGKQDIYISKKVLMKIVDSMDITGFNNEVKEKIINGEDKIDSYDLFYMIGFKEVHAIDVSDFEGADIILDLNETLPMDYVDRFDYVLNGGTLEHIFDIAKAMNNITKLVKFGGSICHIAPAVGMVNHGFYSISPTFFVDFYKKNDFLLNEIKLEFLIRPNSDVNEICSLYSGDIRLIDDRNALNKYIKSIQMMKGGDEVQLVCFATRKTKNCTYGYPLQGYYEDIYKKIENTEFNGANIDFSKLANDIVKLAGRTALYGRGNMFDLLMDELFKIGGEKKVNIVFDKDTRKCGRNYRGIQVVYPVKQRILEGWNTIVICSLAYEKEISNAVLEIIGDKCHVITLSDYIIR